MCPSLGQSERYIRSAPNQVVVLVDRDAVFGVGDPVIYNSYTDLLDAAEPGLVGIHGKREIAYYFGRPFEGPTALEQLEQMDDATLAATIASSPEARNVAMQDPRRRAAWREVQKWHTQNLPPQLAAEFTAVELDAERYSISEALSAWMKSDDDVPLPVTWDDIDTLQEALRIRRVHHPEEFDGNGLPFGRWQTDYTYDWKRGNEIQGRLRPMLDDNVVERAPTAVVERPTYVDIPAGSWKMSFTGADKTLAETQARLSREQLFTKIREAADELRDELIGLTPEELGMRLDSSN